MYIFMKHSDLRTCQWHCKLDFWIGAYHVLQRSSSLYIYTYCSATELFLQSNNQTYINHLIRQAFHVLHSDTPLHDNCSMCGCLQSGTKTAHIHV